MVSDLNFSQEVIIQIIGFHECPFIGKFWDTIVKMLTTLIFILSFTIHLFNWQSAIK